MVILNTLRRCSGREGLPYRKTSLRASGLRQRRSASPADAQHRVVGASGVPSV